MLEDVNEPSIEIKIEQGARKMDPKCVKAPLN